MFVKSILSVLLAASSVAASPVAPTTGLTRVVEAISLPQHHVFNSLSTNNHYSPQCLANRSGAKKVPKKCLSQIEAFAKQGGSFSTTTTIEKDTAVILCSDGDANIALAFYEHSGKLTKFPAKYALKIANSIVHACTKDNKVVGLEFVPPSDYSVSGFKKDENSLYLQMI